MKSCFGWRCSASSSSLMNEKTCSFVFFLLGWGVTKIVRLICWKCAFSLSPPYFDDVEVVIFELLICFLHLLLCFRPWLVSLPCSFSSVLSTSHFHWELGPITLAVLFFMVVQGYANPSFPAKGRSCFEITKQVITFCSIKPLVEDLLFATSSLAKIIGFTHEVILLRGLSLSLSLSLSILFFCLYISLHLVRCLFI